MDPLTASSVVGTWGYPALLLLLVLTAVGSPVPEDLLLIVTGYLVFSEVFYWPAALAICLIGVVVSDVMLYSAGRHLAWHSAYSERHARIRERLQRTAGWFTRTGDRVIFLARLTPGTRALVFLGAGAGAVPVSSFLWYDTLGAVLWVPAMLAVGYLSGSHIGGLEQAIAAAGHYAPWALGGAAGLVLIWVSLGREGSKL